MAHITWSSYFMGIAIISSLRSKDPKTKNKIVGIGYNGLPIGCPDSKEFWIDEDDNNPLRSKHTYVVHAEQNAIYNTVIDLENCTIYTTEYPCNICAQAIIQTGIKKVFYLNINNNRKKRNIAVYKMFRKARVEIEQYQSEIDILCLNYIKGE